MLVHIGNTVKQTSAETLEGVYDLDPKSVYTSGCLGSS